MLKTFVAVMTSALLLVVMPVKAGDFWQQQWTVPGETESNNLTIRPIRESDKARFFHAYMTSQVALQKLGWSWPSEKHTRAKQYNGELPGTGSRENGVYLRCD